MEMSNDIVFFSSHYPSKIHFAQLTRKSFEQYCKIHNYGFFYDDTAAEDTRFHALHYRRSEIIQKAHETYPNAKWYIWIDSDVFVNLPQQKIESVVDLSDENILYHLFKESECGWGCYPINTGVKIVNVKALHWERQIWKARDDPPWNQFPFEQKAVYEYILPKIPGQYKIHEPYKLNCVLQGWPDKVPQAIFVHVCNESQYRRNDIISDYLLRRKKTVGPSFICRALYGKEDKYIDVTNVINNCINLGFTSIKASNNFFTDPISSVIKELIIIDHNGRSKIFREDDIVPLSEYEVN